MPNTPVAKLLQRYEEELCDFSDMERVVGAALRLTSTMPDSQARCLLHALAEFARDKISAEAQAPSEVRRRVRELEAELTVARALGW